MCCVVGDELGVHVACVLTICMIGFKAGPVEPFANVGSASSNSAGVEAGSYHIASPWIFQLLCFFSSNSYQFFVPDSVKHWRSCIQFIKLKSLISINTINTIIITISSSSSSSSSSSCMHHHAYMHHHACMIIIIIHASSCMHDHHHHTCIIMHA